MRQRPAASADLGLLLLGAGISTAGSSLTLIAVLVSVSHRGPAAISLVCAAQLAPIVLGAPAVGWLVDRYRVRPLIALALIGQAGAALGLFAWLPQLPITLLCLMLLGCGDAVTGPAVAALVPAITGETRATMGYSWLGTARSTAVLVGTGAGGALVAGPGTRWALGLDAASFAVMAASCLLIRADRPGAPIGPAGPGRLQAAFEGLRLLGQTPRLALPITGLAVVTWSVTMVNTAEIFFVERVLQSGPAVFGLLGACWGLGLIIGARAAGRLHTDQSLTRALGLTGAVLGLALLAVVAHPAVAISLIAWVFGGCANGAQGVLVPALTRSLTTPAVRGRIFATVDAMLVSATIAGLLSAAPLVAAIGPRQSFAVAGLLALTTAVLSMVAVERHLTPAAEPAIAVEPLR